MADLTNALMRRSLHDRDAAEEARCAACRRTPLAGERLHELEEGRTLCDLCFAALPEDGRRAVSSERVRVAERRLPVVPKAA